MKIKNKNNEFQHNKPEFEIIPDDLAKKYTESTLEPKQQSITKRYIQSNFKLCDSAYDS